MTIQDRLRRRDDDSDTRDLCALIDEAADKLDEQEALIDELENSKIELIGELSTTVASSITYRLKSEEQEALIAELVGALDKYKLFDRFGVEITDGCVVHWTDGGDDLPLDERIAKRWDRIAVADRGANTTFQVIDSPSEQTRNAGFRFNLGSFIWSDTERFLTVVATSEKDYRNKFKNAGECMASVLAGAMLAEREKEE